MLGASQPAPRLASSAAVDIRVTIARFGGVASWQPGHGVNLRRLTRSQPFDPLADVGPQTTNALVDILHDTDAL